MPCGCNGNDCGNQQLCKHRLLLHHLRQSAMRERSLDAARQDFQRSFFATPDASLMFSSMPYTASLTRRPMQYMHLVFLMIFGPHLASSCSFIWRDGIVEFQNFRLRILELRDGSSVIGNVSIDQVGLLLHGGRVHDEKLNPLEPQVKCMQDGVIEFSYARPVPCNGFYFQTVDSSSNKDPVIFDLSAWNEQDANSDSDAVASTVPHLVWTSGAVFDFCDQKWRFFLNRDLRVWQDNARTFSFKPNSMMMLIWTVVLSNQVTGIFLCFVFAYCGKPRVAKAVTICTLSLSASALLVFLYNSDNFISYFHLFVLCTVGVMVYGFERPGLFTYDLGVVGLITLISGFVELYRGMHCQFYLASGCCFVVMALRTHFARISIFNEARHSIAGDQRSYDAVWVQLIGDSNVAKQIYLLTQICNRVNEKCNTDVIRQLCSSKTKDEEHQHLESQDSPISSMPPPNATGPERRLPSSSTSVSSMTSFAERSLQRALSFSSKPISNITPLKSLDTLYSQAFLLEIPLVEKVQSWAEQGRGMFPVHGGEYTLWREAKTSVQSSRQVLWGKLKSEQRAIEKTVRAYRGDCSRITDVVRQQIVFEDVRSLTECMSLIEADEEIRIVRLKNRMDPCFSSDQSAGYRDVCINVQICTKETESLGVQQHVAEVQLILQSFHQLKTESGHKRYVAFRNLQAE